MELKSEKRNNFITHISYEDFKKLNLIGKKVVLEEISEGRKSSKVKEIQLNSLVESQILFWNKTYKDEPVTEVVVAIHLEDCDYPYYLDKWMNKYTGPVSYQTGINIGKIYSTRDYYEAGLDYWKVKKKETKAVYIIHL